MIAELIVTVLLGIILYRVMNGYGLLLLIPIGFMLLNWLKGDGARILLQFILLLISIPVGIFLLIAIGAYLYTMFIYLPKEKKLKETNK